MADKEKLRKYAEKANKILANVRNIFSLLEFEADEELAKALAYERFERGIDADFEAIVNDHIIDKGLEDAAN